MNFYHLGTYKNIIMQYEISYRREKQVKGDLSLQDYSSQKSF